MYTSIKLFLRTLSRKKLFSLINIIGLSLGFLCATLIFLYVENEMSYDKFHKNGDNIYRINQTFIWGEDTKNQFASTGPGVGYAILEEIPDVDQVVRVHQPSLLPAIVNIEKEEKFFHNEVILAADSNFFQVFSYPLISGDRKTALKEVNTVVLTEEAVSRFFGTEDAMGKLIELGEGPNKGSYKVTGVLAKQRSNSYIEFDMLVSMASIDRVKRSNWSWMWTQFETFVLLKENSNSSFLQEKLNLLPEKYAAETLDVMGYTYEEYIAAGKEWNLYLQPFTDIHLHSSNVINRLNGAGNFKVVAALIVSAIFIVLLSCINFINLSTSQFTTKAKNASLRKVLGSSRSSLRKTYFSESLLFCLVSAILSIGLTYYVLPFFNDTVGLNLTFSLIDNPFYLLVLVALVLFISSLAGLYPALFFSAFKPIEVMKGELKSGKGGIKIRNGMMIVQYTLSLLLIICSVTVYQQLRHVFNSDMGFEKENLITVDNVHWANIYWQNSPDAFVNELKSVEGVKGASLCDATPLLVYNGDQFQPDKPGSGSLPLNYVLADESYIDLLELEMVIGRSFDKSYSNDVTGIILNETAVQSIGWDLDESIINKKISNWSGEYHVVGVVKDFNYWSLQSPIEPFAIFHSASNAQSGRPLERIALSISAENTMAFNNVIDDLKEKWTEFAPNRPFEYTILDQVFAYTYESEEQFGKVITSFALLTIVIATLGLLGMVIFSIEQKLKEIGIRKVLGASSLSIASIFTKSYIKLLLVALLLATPIGYLLMENWLSDFDYRIQISPLTFVLSGGLLLFVSMSISLYHSLKASGMNPAEVLKDE